MMEPAQNAHGQRALRGNACIALSLLLSIIGAVVPATSGSVPMRVVKQSAGLDELSAVHGQRQQRQLNRVAPRPFSGPEHLRSLLGRCFSRTSQGYRYSLCPFGNATQAEESARWNAYSGILGVWQGWSAANGSLDKMHYGSGDSCGTVNRSVEVRLMCGLPQTSLVEVSEPERCHYSMVLSSPVVCHPDSLLVWPILSEHQRQQWSLADSRLYSGEITTKGHAAELAQILWEAGLGIAPPVPTAKPAFADLAIQCHTAYQELDN